MDFPARSLPRLAYSFPSGTCDLIRCGSGCAVTGDAEGTAAVMLESDWRGLLPCLQDLGGVLASAMAGPLSLAQMWISPEFISVPGSFQMLDVATGAELELARLRRVMAVVEQSRDGQEIISLQFFDAQGDGVLKLILTNLSDVEAFEELVRDFAVPFPGPSRPRAERPDPPSCRIPAAEMVRGLWRGLERTHPGSEFPGVPDCLRYAALQAAGLDYAWPISEGAVRLALTGALEEGAELKAGVRNRAVFSPGSLRLTSVSSCGCGTTWFSAQSQLTIRVGGARFMARVPDPAAGDAGRPPEIECYHPDGAFYGLIRLDPRGSSGKAVDDWRAALAAIGSIG